MFIFCSPLKLRIREDSLSTSLSLYYFLAQRLALGLTTFFQNAPGYVWLFNESGVCRLFSNIRWDEIRDLSRDHTAWALLDSNWRVNDPAPILIDEVAYPHDKRLGWVKYHGNSTQYFYGNPFTLKEILQGVYIICSIRYCHLTGIALRKFGSTPSHPIKMTCATSSSIMVRLPANVITQRLVQAITQRIPEKLNRIVTRMSWNEIDSDHLVTRSLKQTLLLIILSTTTRLTLSCLFNL